MGMKLPIAATTIVCSACIAASVASPAVDLPGKIVKNEASRSVTQEYKLLAVTDPVTGVVTLIALPLQDLGKINKFFVDNLINPLFTLASSPLNIPTQISNQVPPETAIQTNITVPIQKLQAFPDGLAALIQDILGGADAMAAARPNVALAADPATGVVSPVTALQDLGKINKFFVDNLINPLFTLASSPLNIPTQISNQVPPETAIQTNITVPIQKLQAFPDGFADLVRDILGGASGFAAAEAAPLNAGSTLGSRVLAKPSITGVSKSDPTLGSTSSITDVPGSGAGTGTGTANHNTSPRHAC